MEISTTKIVTFSLDEAEQRAMLLLMEQMDRGTIDEMFAARPDDFRDTLDTLCGEIHDKLMED